MSGCPQTKGKGRKSQGKFGWEGVSEKNCNLEFVPLSLCVCERESEFALSNNNNCVHPNE